jgi:hypothetical protein
MVTVQTPVAHVFPSSTDHSLRGSKDEGPSLAGLESWPQLMKFSLLMRVAHQVNPGYDFYDHLYYQFHVSHSHIQLGHTRISKLCMLNP